MVYSWWDNVKAACNIFPDSLFLDTRKQCTGLEFCSLPLFLIGSLFAWPFSIRHPLAYSQLWLPRSSDSFLQHFEAVAQEKGKKKQTTSANDKWKERLKTMDRLAEWKPPAVFHVDFKLQNSRSCQLLGSCAVPRCPQRCACLFSFVPHVNPVEGVTATVPVRRRSSVTSLRC